MKGYVNATIASDGIATITFHHPAQNSLPGNILNEIALKIDEIGASKEAKIIILKSEGSRVFCAGASFEELSAIENKDAGREFFSGFSKIIIACSKCPLIILGRIHGKAVGGGVGVAAATDYCFATKDASVKLSELVVGIGPFVVGPAVERKVGLSAYSQLALNAAVFYDAQWALNKGLYAHVFESEELMDAAINEFAKTLIAYNMDALKELKKVFWEGTSHWETLLNNRAIISGELVLSDHTKTFINTVKNK
jgi:methylglutaconyl-CoA hydratase